MQFLQRTRNALLDFLFPKGGKIVELENLSASELLQKLPPAEWIGDKSTIAVFSYAHPLVRDLVWEVKYRGNRLVADKLGEILSDVIQEELSERALFDMFESPVLVPVPVSDKRRFERGWNQSELLTSAIKKRDINSELKHLPRQLAKVVHTESQTKTATKSERQNNLKNTMRVLNPASVAGRCVILVDDVTTTGSTFAEAKRALREAGAKKIICIAVAH